MRNAVAHPTSYHLLSPIESARAIRDLGEIINRLWGALTPGGRLYPAPVPREVMAVGWNADATRYSLGRADQLEAQPDDDITTYLIVRAVADDPGLWDFDAHREQTNLPSDYLWGPGTQANALSWLATASPAGDTVQYLDRPFLIREDHESGRAPYRPAAARLLPAEDRDGRWHVVLADYPADAVMHVRRLAAGDPACAAEGECATCPAESRATGTLDEALAAFIHLAGPISNACPLDGRVPPRW